MRDTKKLETRLTAEQIKAAQLLAVNKFLPKTPQDGEQGRRTYEEVAAEASVTVRQLYNWRTNSRDFIDYVNALASDAFLAHLPDVMEKHLDMTIKGQGSMKGIELFYKFGGLLIDRQEVKTDDGGASQSLDERLARLQERAKTVVDPEDTE